MAKEEGNEGDVSCDVFKHGLSHCIWERDIQNKFCQAAMVAYLLRAGRLAVCLSACSRGPF